ncbi:mechanosensitive ion channel family protein [Pseudomarimonas salicorniae]|uniref:Small-conductance mechanosensitive channel n=1 Tax=Pseudomarimonas salicorniae TaxID=2933270 RepID=A0ABT0GFC4_9GAMM|nr:mechanosensitive ion channel family protein [Lysobacter sp. CAU 1642]MCK7593239.1 mechanosensitive ion channel family protein [Lysobacter sp. CAU 1642]
MPRLCLFLAWLILLLSSATMAQGSSSAADPEASAEAALARAGLEALQVRAEDGVLRVEGVVADNAEREAALAVVRDAVDPLPVDDRMRLDTSFETRLTPTLKRLRELWSGILDWLPLLAVAALIVAVARGIGGWLSRRRWVARLGGGNPYLATMAGQAVRVVSFGLGLLLAMELLDLTAMVGALLGAAGVVGIAMGFAFKDIIENHLAGVLLSLRQPFAPNDHLSIDGHEGKVVGLTSRATLLMTLDGNHLRIPNSKVFNAVILNYSRNPLRRFEFDLGVGGDDDLVRAQQIGLEAITASGLVSSERAPRASVVALGDSSVVVRFTGWVDQRRHDFTAARSACLVRVKQCLEERGVSLPEPQFRVTLEGIGESQVPRGPAAAPAKPKPAAGAASVDSAALSSAPSTDVDADLAEERDQLGETNLLKPRRDE